MDVSVLCLGASECESPHLCRSRSTCRGAGVLPSALTLARVCLKGSSLVRVRTGRGTSYWGFCVRCMGGVGFGATLKYITTEQYSTTAQYITTVEYITTVQNITTVQYSTTVPHYSTVYSTTVHYSTQYHSTVQYTVPQYSTVQSTTVQYST